MPSPREDWVPSKADPCENHSCLLGMALVSPSPYPQAMGRSRYGRFLRSGVGGDSKRRLQHMPGRKPIGCLPRFYPRKRRTARYLGFARGIPARKSSAALSGRRPGPSSLAGERLSRVLGAVIFRHQPYGSQKERKDFRSGRRVCGKRARRAAHIPWL
ncbi:hypothetical protein MPNT_320013 [Candidatus Methylacidithermus pantelleriae]|uniref:Uncharacterized protein n=1 Tax=Candidatus Methylacidithermus pantelleriae TaxID=2744239 RepID=A0A8J2BNX8_9BACT|nr:hypothetical protein MPNT_320013 [Candidatus Methylacidithermus pantelleriae]